MPELFDSGSRNCGHVSLFDPGHQRAIFKARIGGSIGRHVEFQPEAIMWLQVQKSQGKLNMHTHTLFTFSSAVCLHFCRFAIPKNITGIQNGCYHIWWTSTCTWIAKRLQLPWQMTKDHFLLSSSRMSVKELRKISLGPHLM